MEKISEKKYAEILYRAVKGKDRRKAKDTISGFVDFLASEGDLKKAERIIGKFEEIWNEREGEIPVTIATAGEIRQATVKEIEKYLKNILQADKLTISAVIDKSLLGGMVIRYKDKVWDASLKAKLESLREKIVK